MTNDKYFIDNIHNYVLIDEKPYWNICICGCDKCASLFQICHKPSKISFAIGSFCVKNLFQNFHLIYQKLKGMNYKFRVVFHCISKL